MLCRRNGLYFNIRPSVKNRISKPSKFNQRNLTHSVMNCRPLNFDTLNPKVKKVQYAVRGAIVIRATEIEKELSQVKLHS